MPILFPHATLSFRGTKPGFDLADVSVERGTGVSSGGLAVVALDCSARNIPTGATCCLCSGRGIPTYSNVATVSVDVARGFGYLDLRKKSGHRDIPCPSVIIARPCSEAAIHCIIEVCESAVGRCKVG